MGGRILWLASLATTWKMRLRLVLKLVLMLICYWWLGSERKKNCNYLEDAIEVGLMMTDDWWCCWTCWERRIVTTCNYFEDADEFDWDADVVLYIDADDRWLSFVGKKYCNYLEDVDEVQSCNSCNRFSSWSAIRREGFMDLSCAMHGCEIFSRSM